MVVGTVAYLAWSYVLSQMPVTRATPLLYLIPVITLILAWLVLGRRPGATT